MGYCRHTGFFFVCLEIYYSFLSFNKFFSIVYYLFARLSLIFFSESNVMSYVLVSEAKTVIPLMEQYQDK